MSDEKPHELLIIKRNRGGHDSHHGGAWKIAFADFMTAMMALFLVLWLVSATSEKTKVSIARYFNPVKLVDMSTMKKGVSDPNENISTSPDAPGEKQPRKSESSAQPGAQKDVPAREDNVADPGAGATHLPTHSEAALFRDPYAVLAEIVAAGEATEADAGKNAVGSDKAGEADNGSDTAEPFKDPFKLVIPEIISKKSADQKVAASGQQASPASAASASGSAAVQAADPSAGQKKIAGTHAQIADQVAIAAALAPAGAASQNVGKATGGAAAAVADTGTADRAQKQVSASEAEAAKMQGEIAVEIAKVVGKAGNARPLPNVEIKSSDDGILISLTDQYDYAMFAVGSAEPQARTILVMDKIAAVLKKYPGSIVIRGHTDGRIYKGANYDNWRLSADRAHMAQFMLTRGGVDPARIEKIEGYADHKLKNSKNPLADENRRIEILLRKNRT